MVICEDVAFATEIQAIFISLLLNLVSGFLTYSCATIVGRSGHLPIRISELR